MLFKSNYLKQGKTNDLIVNGIYYSAVNQPYYKDDFTMKDNVDDYCLSKYDPINNVYNFEGNELLRKTTICM